MQAHWIRWGREIVQRLRSKILPKEAYNTALTARTQAEILVSTIAPDAHLYLEGSIVTTGLLEEGSDLDMCCCSSKYGSVPNALHQRKLSETIYNALNSTTPDWCNFQLIKMVRIPLIKYDATIMNREYKCDPVISRTVVFRFNTLLSNDDHEKVLRKLGDEKIERTWIEDHGGKHSVHIQASTNASALKILCTEIKECVLNEKGKIVRDLEDRMHVPELFRFPFDITFLGYAVRNSYLIREYLMDVNGPRSSRLCQMAIKRWGKETEVGVGAQGNLTSYALTIMWIYFLLRTGQLGWIDPWTIPEALHLPRYPDYAPFPDENEIDYGEISEQLYEFFNFLSKLNYDKEVISLSRPGITTREMIGWNEREREKFHYNLCIEDPYEDDLNCARRMNNKKMIWYKDLLAEAMNTLRASPRTNVHKLIGGARFVQGT